MQQDLAARTLFCHARAKKARDSAKQATSALLRARYLAAEGRWLTLAQSNERLAFNREPSSKRLGGEPKRRDAGSFSYGPDQKVFREGYIAGWQSVRGAVDEPMFVPRSPVFVGLIYMIGFSRGTRDARS
jgi:hypothetical protein